MYTKNGNQLCQGISLYVYTNSYQLCQGISLYVYTNSYQLCQCISLYVYTNSYQLCQDINLYIKLAMNWDSIRSLYVHKIQLSNVSRYKFVHKTGYELRQHKKFVRIYKQLSQYVTSSSKMWEVGRLIAEQFLMWKNQIFLFFNKGMPIPIKFYKEWRNLNTVKIPFCKVAVPLVKFTIKDVKMTKRQIIATLPRFSTL